jgi:signal peptidase II
VDQIMKRWIVANFAVDSPHQVIGDWLRIDFIHNNGGLFGLFQGQALIFAAVTIAVASVLAFLEFGSGWRNWLVTITLGLLLGGAIGNFIDRISYGYVIDFADIGIGSWRFYIFNVADSAVTVAILLMLGIWFVGPILGIHVDLDGPKREHLHPAEPADDRSSRRGEVVLDRHRDGDGR